jgi:rod shape-determining protein MreD
MILTVVKNFLLILLVVVWETAMRRLLPGWLASINLAIIFLVYFGILKHFRLSIIYAVILGAFLDLYSPIFFGAKIISLSFTFFIIELIFTRLLTNRSVYAVSLFVVVALFLESTISVGLKFIYLLIKDAQMDYSLWGTSFHWQYWLTASIINIGISMIVFLLFYFFSNQFKNILLQR